MLKERQEQRAREPPVQHLGLQEIQELENQAMKIIPNKVRYYAEQIGVSYGESPFAIRKPDGEVVLEKEI